MLVIRPVTANDLGGLLELAGLAQVGLTTLPHDKKILRERIEESLASFQKASDKPGGEVYFFVMEDAATKKIVGTSSIVSKVGGFEPFYTYKIKTVLKQSKTLGVKKQIQYLKLVRVHSGPSEIGTLFLNPSHRKDGNGRFLSFSRFLFLAQYPKCFETDVIAELRGVIDASGRSPFWEALGQHFFDVALKKADLMVMKNKSFIADLMPEHPIYIPLLTRTAQAVIGKVHDSTVPALHLLKQEGFKDTDEIDIFEAGPLVSCSLTEIRTVRESKEAQIGDVVNNPIKSPPFMIANVTAFQAFRAVRGNIIVNAQGKAQITSEVASALGVSTSDQIRFAPQKLGTSKRE